MSAKELPTPEEMQEMAEVDLKNIDTSIGLYVIRHTMYTFSFWQKLESLVFY